MLGRRSSNARNATQQTDVTQRLQAADKSSRFSDARTPVDKGKSRLETNLTLTCWWGSSLSRKKETMTHYLAIDIETTGLDFKEDHVIEIAWTILGNDLGQVSPLRSFVIKRDAAPVLARLHQNRGAFDMHAANGLLVEVLTPNAGEWLSIVLGDLIDDIDEYVPAGEKPYLLGNSVEFDRRMLSERSKDFANAIHYRNLDVRALQQIAQAAGVAETFDFPAASNAHRAADDIGWSIGYAQNFARIIGQLSGE